MVASGTRGAVNEFASEDLHVTLAVSDTRGTKRKNSKQAMDEFTLFVHIFVASGTRDTISKNTKCASGDLLSYG